MKFLWEQQHILYVYTVYHGLATIVIRRVYGRCLVVDRELQPGEDRATELDLTIGAGKVVSGSGNKKFCGNPDRQK